MLLYIDYLDHITSGDYSFKPLEIRLRYDLLIFAGDTLLMSVPACVKLADTTELLMQLTPFWNGKKIQLQLDKKHRGNPINYFNNRKRVLSKAMKEEELVNHFEFVAYEDKRTPIFFREYLPEKTSVGNTVYIGKNHDTDKLFRDNASWLFEKDFNIISSILTPSSRVKYHGIVDKIIDYSNDTSMLFQRQIVEKNIKDEFAPSWMEEIIIATQLDRAFSLANAYTSDAFPLSLIHNQLTGKWFSELLSRSYRELFNNLCMLSWDDLYQISQDSDLRNLIDMINAGIFAVQNSRIYKYPSGIDECINKLTYNLSLIQLIKGITKKAVEAMEQSMFQQGFQTEAQNLGRMMNLAAEGYQGKYKSLMDTLLAIDVYASRLNDKLKTERKYKYLKSLSDRQKEKEIELKL